MLCGLCAVCGLLFKTTLYITKYPLANGDSTLAIPPISRFPDCFALQGKRQKRGRNERKISAVPTQQNWGKNEAQKEKKKAAGL
jgi:hypothetical protein